MNGVGAVGEVRVGGARAVRYVAEAGVGHSGRLAGPVEPVVGDGRVVAARRLRRPSGVGVERAHPRERGHGGHALVAGKGKEACLVRRGHEYAARALLADADARLAQPRSHVGRLHIREGAHGDGRASTDVVQPRRQLEPRGEGHDGTHAARPASARRGVGATSHEIGGIGHHPEDAHAGTGEGQLRRTRDGDGQLDEPQPRRVRRRREPGRDVGEVAQGIEHGARQADATAVGRLCGRAGAARRRGAHGHETDGCGGHRQPDSPRPPTQPDGRGAYRANHAQCPCSVRAYRARDG